MNFAKSLVSCYRVQTGSYVSQPDGYLVYLAEAAGRERIPPNLKQIQAHSPLGVFLLGTDGSQVYIAEAPGRERTHEFCGVKSPVSCCRVQTGS